MNIELWVPVIVAFISSVAASGIIAVIAQRKKVAADTASTLVDTAGDIVAEYKSQLKECKEEISKLREELESTEAKLEAAYIQIRRLQEENKYLNRRITGLEH